jgi:hypothetical protein
MNALSNEMIRSAKEFARHRIQVYEGTRVARCERVVSKKDGMQKFWKLFGDGLGHEQATANAVEQSVQNILGEFDELIVSDHMAAAMPSWHPCHIVGLEEAVPELVSTLRDFLGWDESERRFTAVKPLFSCMVAFERDPMSQTLRSNFDAAAVQGSDVLQWVCAQDSRPHGDEESFNNEQKLERWILMSTTDFAAKCLGTEGMSKDATLSSQSTKVEYIPQTDDYLRSDPASLMCQEFMQMIERSRSSDNEMPRLVYSKCQRWGAAFTMSPTGDNQTLTARLKAHEAEHSITLCGDYVNALLSSRSSSTKDKESDSLAIEGAALSGINAAKRISSRI